MPIIMKVKTLIFAILLPCLIYSQKYVLLDSLRKYKLKEYTLNTKDIYNENKTIKIYNVFITKNNILLFSVLPDLENGSFRIKENKMPDWEIVNFDQIKDQIFTNDQIKKLSYEWSIDNTPERKTLDYKIVKKENGIYYVSKFCLTELFNISNIEFPLISSYGVINIMDKLVTIKQMQSSFKKQFPDSQFILDVREENFLRNMSISYSYRNYLSSIIKIKNDTAYKFWTFDGWWTQDGYNEHRGIDRFLYIPEKGIVGGSYDFYFKLKPKISSNNYFTESDKKLWENIINEKIMIANELK